MSNQAFQNQVTKTPEEAKVQVEQVRLRQRNSFEVINQIVTEYNSSNGWSLVKVIPTPLNIEVFLERSSKQADKDVEVKKQQKEVFLLSG